MKLFESTRLVIKTLETNNKDSFIELLSDEQIIKPIPQTQMTKSEISEKFEESLNLNKNLLLNKRCAWGVFEKGNIELIGLCLFLTNNENDRELGYRFKPNYWGKGYGTELTKAMIDFCFTDLKLNKITADVNIENSSSVKILEKFMSPVKEFHNDIGNCTDRRYVVEKNIIIKC